MNERMHNENETKTRGQNEWFHGMRCDGTIIVVVSSTNAKGNEEREREQIHASPYSA
jgi:hypothetical protein